MSAPVLLLSPRFSNDSKLLWAAAGKKGWRVARPIRWSPHDVGPVNALHGELDWARYQAGYLGLNLLDPPNDWLTRLPAYLLGRHVQFGELAELNVTYPAFIKPPDYKSFPAVVYEAPPMVEGDVIVSEPVRILHEVRTWILDGKVVTASVYVEDGRLEEISEMRLDKAISVAEEAARTQGTPHAVVIDVMFILPGRWVVIEANPVYASGIYARADVSKVIDVLQAACSRK